MVSPSHPNIISVSLSRAVVVFNLLITLILVVGSGVRVSTSGLHRYEVFFIPLSRSLRCVDPLTKCDHKEEITYK
jgi:hypothetical protein